MNLNVPFLKGAISYLSDTISLISILYMLFNGGCRLYSPLLIQIELNLHNPLFFLFIEETFFDIRFVNINLSIPAH